MCGNACQGRIGKQQHEMKMKKILIKISYIGITTIVLYLFSAFILMELNPFYWPLVARFLYATLTGVISLILTIEL